MSWHEVPSTEFVERSVVDLRAIMSPVSVVFEVSGVLVIAGGFVFALFRSLALLRTGDPARAYGTVRRVFGKSLLLGLEILVAADLIRTVAVEPTLEGLYVLGLLIVIRSFLSWSLDVELEGAWPWNKRRLEDDEQSRGLRRQEL